MKRRLLCFALLALLGSGLGAGCGPSLEADVQDLEITWPALHFDSAPPVSAGTVTLTQSFELDASATGWPKQLNANVHATSVRFRAVAGVANLDFIQSARVGLGENRDGGGDDGILTYRRTATADAGAEVVMTSADPIDITKAWASQRIRVDVTVTGTPPKSAWAIDVTLYLSGQLSYGM